MPRRVCIGECIHPACLRAPSSLSCNPPHCATLSLLCNSLSPPSSILGATTPPTTFLSAEEAPLSPRKGEHGLAAEKPLRTGCGEKVKVKVILQIRAAEPALFLPCSEPQRCHVLGPLARVMASAQQRGRTRVRGMTAQTMIFPTPAGRASSSSSSQPHGRYRRRYAALQELNDSFGDSGVVHRHRRAQPSGVVGRIRRAHPASTTASVAAEPALVQRSGGDVGSATTSGALTTSDRAGSSKLVPEGVPRAEEGGASDQAMRLLKRMRPDELRELSKAAAALEKTKLEDGKKVCATTCT